MIARLQVLADLNLSQPNEIRLPLLWLAVLSGRGGPLSLPRRE